MANSLWLYSALMLFSSVLGLAKTLLLASLLGPAAYGQYAIFEIVSSYSLTLVGFGVVHGLKRQLPEFISNSTEGQLASILSSSRFVILLHGLAASLFCLVFYGLDRSGLVAGFSVPFYIYAGVIFGVFLVAFQLELTAIISRMHYIQFATSSVLKIFFALLLSLLLIEIFGLEGALLSEFVSVIAVLSFVYVFFKVKPSLNIQKKVARHYLDLSRSEIFRVGSPLALQSAVRMVYSSIDKFILAYFIGDVALGVYNFSMLQVLVALILINISVQYVSPRIYRASSDEVGLWKKRLTLFVFSLLLAGIVFGPIYLWGAKKFIFWAFPEYADALDILGLLYVAALFSMFSIFEIFYVAARRVYWYTVVTVAAILLSVASFVVVGVQGLGVFGFAVCFLVLKIIYAAFIYIDTMRMKIAL